MTDLIASVLVFTVLVMSLVLLVLATRQLLAPRGTVTVRINDARSVSVGSGLRLLEALRGAGIHLPAACGGKGTCGLCRVTVTSGGGPALPLETDRFGRRELAAGARLACQVVLRHDLEAQVPQELLEARSVEMVVRTNRQVATLMRELVLELPPDTAFPFRTGSFVQLTCPPYSLQYADLQVDGPYRAEWDRLDLWRHVAGTEQPTQRAYSLANHADEEGLMLIVRLATPPPGAPGDVPPGIVSSWVFGLRPGDPVQVSGPYGDFFVDRTDRELVFVGGGAGMGPMRAHILDQLEVQQTQNPVTFFYGARNLGELFYTELFDRLQQTHNSFHQIVALSEPRTEDGWVGPTGYIHEHLQEWAAAHERPESCDYYLCGPPLMLRAVKSVLESAGVPATSVHADDFGGSP